MMKRVLLAASLLATPVFADIASDSAITYLSSACADGNERLGFFDTNTTTFKDITISSTPTAVDVRDDEPLLAHCETKDTAIFHCHPSHDALSRFPSDQDIANAADLAYRCALRAKKASHRPTTLTHHVVNGAITTSYRISGYLPRIEELAHQDIERESRSLSLNPNDVIDGLRARDDMMMSLYATWSGEYRSDVLSFIRSVCPDVKTTGVLCPEVTLENFIASRTGDEPYRFWIERTPLPRINPVVAPLSQSRYPPWITELTPENYARFLQGERVLVLRCAKGNSFHPTCDAAVHTGERLRQYCHGLDVGIVDTDKHHVRSDYDVFGLASEELFERGERVEITAPNLTPWMFGLIMCGMHADANGRLLFPGVSETDPLESIYHVMERMQRAIDGGE